MKRISFIIFFISIVSLGFAKEPEEKTFLILFDKAELKANKTSTTYIELSLNNVFKTKSYAGNSDAAIIVKVPYDNLDTCQLADFFIRVNSNKVASLGEIALQIIDMNECKNTYDYLVASFDDKTQKNKKSGKAVKAAPSP
ncbi:hypothetical protein [Aquiflexum lacus]|uniref:hypothetical protein n=1 Tax=Aquiflexum lacus TaxID=2483805 RepID=UPI001895DA9B|nr:hypothetical protein [Aquiflexum lacus]